MIRNDRIVQLSFPQSRQVDDFQYINPMLEITTSDVLKLWRGIVCKDSFWLASHQAMELLCIPVRSLAMQTGIEHSETDSLSFPFLKAGTNSQLVNW